MNKAIRLFLLIVFFLLLMGCNEESSSIQSISIDFPLGGKRLLVQRNGEAYLFYGALPQYQKIKDNTFDIDELYKQLRTRLHDNVPREKWPNPKATGGMVTIRFDNKTKKDYLIFDKEAFTKRLFNMAKENIVRQVP